MITVNVEQNTDDWKKHRFGRPTASMASSLVTSQCQPSKSLNTYANKLAADMFCGRDTSTFNGTAATEYGHEMEAESRSWYSMETDTDLAEAHFYTDSENTFGASPDSVVGPIKNAKDEVVRFEGVVDFKNQQTKGHIESLLYWHKHNKPPTTYIPQIHFQMLVCDAEWGDLVYYSADGLPSIICRIQRDSEFDEMLLEQIDLCIKQRDKTLTILQEMAE